jgi:hypothetical protein
MSALLQGLDNITAGFTAARAKEGHLRPLFFIVFYFVSVFPKTTTKMAR